MPANGLPNKAIEHRDEIIQRLSNGERLTAIASDLGYLSHSTIATTLRNDPGYVEAVKHSAWAKLEAREEQLENASEQTDITRSRELLNHARWWAERVNREQFAPKPDIVINNNTLVSVDGALGQDAAKLLDQLRTVSNQPQTADAALLLPILPVEDK